MKKQSKKWMLVALALLAMVALPLVGCKNDSVSEPVRYTVTFNTDGGSTVQSQTVESGQKVPEPAEPTKNSHFFDGWYRDEQFTNKYDFNDQVTSSFPLYAKWLTEKEITSTTVSNVISKLSGEGPYTLVATGEWTDGFSTLAEKLKNESKKVNLDLSKVSGLTTIGEMAFHGCSSLKSITIPASVKTIWDRAFFDCSSLEEVTMEANTPPELRTLAFDKTADTLKILVPNAVNYTNDAAKDKGWGSYFDKIKTEITPTTVEDVISKLSGVGPHSLVATGEWSSDDLSAISTALNDNPTAKVNLDLSGVEELTTIGEWAFSYCSSLVSITIPASVTTIVDGAFFGCSSLYISVDEYNTTYSSKDGMLLNKEETILIAYPLATGTVTNVPASVQTIGDGAFDACVSLTIVTFAEGSQLTTIGPTAFRSCSSLKSITIPASVTTIGNSAFGGCTNLTIITIPASVQTIGVSAFEGCSKLDRVTFAAGSKLTTIGEYAFRGCTNLKSITIPASVQTIGDGAFDACVSLTIVTFAEGSQLTTIGPSAFSACGLQSITIPASVTTIGDEAFYGCRNLEEVTMEATTPPTLGLDAFSNTSTGLQILVPKDSESAYKEESDKTESNWYQYKNNLQAKE